MEREMRSESVAASCFALGSGQTAASDTNQRLLRVRTVM